MNTRTSVGLLVATVAVLVFSTAPANGFNITRLLDQHPEFSNFNSLLSQTGVAQAVNSRETITVLAVDNSATGGLNSQSNDVLQAIMATHVILDYYDMVKLGSLSKNKSALLTTLYQSTGRAEDEQGFVNVTVDHNQVVFGSAVKGAQRNSQLIKVVAAQPFNISVLQVSSVIIPPGIAQTTPSPPTMAPPPRKVGPSPPAPAPSSDSSAPSPSDAPAADSPADDDNTPPPSKTPSPAPAASAPASGPAPGPTDDDVADKKDGKKSGGSRVVTSGGLFLVATTAVAALVAL